jgi:hypothetical protein
MQSNFRVLSIHLIADVGTVRSSYPAKPPSIYDYEKKVTNVDSMSYLRYLYTSFYRRFAARTSAMTLQIQAVVTTNGVDDYQKGSFDTTNKFCCSIFRVLHGLLLTSQCQRFGTSSDRSHPTIRIDCHFFRTSQVHAMMPCQPTPNDIPREILVYRRAPIVVPGCDCCCCSRWEDRIVCGRHRPSTPAPHRFGASFAKKPPRRESPPVQPRRSVDAGVNGPSAAATYHRPPSSATPTEHTARRRTAPTRSLSTSHACATREIRELPPHRTVSV